MKKIFFALLSLGISAQAFAKTDNEQVDSLRSQNLEPVTVYSTRTSVPLKLVPTKLEVIPARNIEQSGFTNMTDLLKSQSSLDVTQYPGFNSNIGIRGFKPSGKYVNVLVNGIPAGTDNISTLSVQDIEQIEILKGPFSSIYGTNAMGGIINVITKKSKDKVRGNVSLGGGSYETVVGAFNMGGRFEDIFSFDLSVGLDKQNRAYKTGTKNFLSLSPLEELIVDPKTQGQKMENSDYTIGSGRLRFGIDFAPGWSLNVYENLFIGNDIPLGGSIWKVYGQTKKNLNRSATSAELLGQVGNHSLQFSPYYNVEKAENYDKAGPTGFVDFKSDYTSLGALLQDKISFGRHNVVVGVDARSATTNSERFSQAGVNTLPYNPGYSTNNLGVFGQANFYLLDNALTLTAGARADFMAFILKENKYLHNDYKRENHNVVSPNVGLRYEFVKGLTAHATYGSAFTAPDAYQKAGYYVGAFGTTMGNPDLKPERSATFDFGFGYNNPACGIQADVTYFHTDHKDLIMSVYDANYTTTYVNTDKARMSGIEAMLSYDFGTLFANKFSLRAFMNGTFMLNAEMKGDAADSQWTDLYYVRKQNVTFGLDFRCKQGLELMLNGRFMGRRIEQNWYTYYPEVRPDLAALLQAEEPELAAKGLLRHPQALVFNAAAYYHFNKVLSVGLHLNNILDENYTEKDGYNMPGRNLFGKLTVNF